ncbi:hypothetical protein NHX12_010869 [Muraenolepis orangiensis]|uniref:Uncharacterized protein n=1 Tax=Muraenolepis orangiensis TaxID=630683 RepID=A0A9Q0DFA0_9TELE|nr:hypothetical protein NHX12_010869 [Muraenolepis orangiensis]
MDTSGGESKPVCQCVAEPRSGCHLNTGVRQWLPGWPIALCLVLSMSSIAVCLLMSFKTFQLESRLQMEMDKMSTLFHPSHHSAFLNQDGTLVPELRTPIEKLLEEVSTFL